jgi:hypothetical protein
MCIISILLGQFNRMLKYRNEKVGEAIFQNPYLADLAILIEKKSLLRDSLNKRYFTVLKLI